MLENRCPECQCLLKDKDIKNDKCWKCGSVTTIPENAEIISESDITEKLDNSEKHDNGPTQIKSNIKDKKSELKNGSGYKGKANSPFFTVVQIIAVMTCLASSVFGLFGIFIMIKHYDYSLIYGFIVIPILCGVIVLFGLASLIGVVRVLETDMENLHQENNNG